MTRLTVIILSLTCAVFVADAILMKDVCINPRKVKKEDNPKEKEELDKILKEISAVCKNSKEQIRQCMCDEMNKRFSAEIIKKIVNIMANNLKKRKEIDAMTDKCYEPGVKDHISCYFDGLAEICADLKPAIDDFKKKKPQ